MGDEKEPQTKPYTVTGAFVWDGRIRKPSDDEPVHLTEAQAHGLKKRGKIEDAPEGTKAKKATAKKPAAKKAGEGTGAAS